MKKWIGGFVLVAVLGLGYFLGSKVNPSAGSANNGIDMASRSPAQATGPQQQILDQLNEKIINIRSRQEVKKVAREIVDVAAQPQNRAFPGVQIYGAIAALIPDFEGFVYRCRDFVDNADILHTTTLFKLRDFKYNNYLYGPHVDALFDYLTYPSEAAGSSFKNVSDLQDYLLKIVAPKLKRTLEQADELEKLPASAFEFQFDRTVLVGRGNGIRFIDPEETKKLFIKPYFFTVKFLLQRALGSIYYLAAIDLNEMPVIYNRILKETAINTFKGDLRIGDTAKGVTPQMTYEVIKKSKSFLGWRSTLPASQVQQLLDNAYFMGVMSAKYQLAAYVCSLKYPQERARGQILEVDVQGTTCLSSDGLARPGTYFIPEGSRYLMDPNSVALNFKKEYNMFRDRYRVYAENRDGKHVAITSDVTGKTLRLNIKALFSGKTSPRDLLPTGYLKVPGSSDAVGLRGVYAWNYDHGKPTEFADYSMGGFFDSAQVRDSASLYEAMTTLLYTDAVAPFAIFVRVPSTARYFVPPSEIVRQ